MNYGDINTARNQAERDIQLADVAIRQAVRLICGRLRSASVSYGALCELKKELKNYNMNTLTWKD